MTRELKAAVQEGRNAILGDATGRPVISARLVRDMVLDPRTSGGIHIVGATLDACLNLANARGSSGAPCNPLILEDCVLMGEGPLWPGIDARHSHLQRLALIGCQCTGVDLSGAVVVGDLVLDGIRPRDGGGGRDGCWVKGRDVRVGGSITARRAKLNIPLEPGALWPQADAPHFADVRAPFALDLEGAHIAGSLILQPEFEAIGGVTVAGSTIGGEFWAEGAHLTAALIGSRSVEALRAQYLRIQGPVALRRDRDARDNGRFRAEGQLGFYGANIRGTLDLSGAQVIPPDAADAGAALDCYSAAFEADVLLFPSGDDQCEIPTVGFGGVTIGGSLVIDAGAATPMESLEAAGIRINGDLTILGSMSRIDLAGSVIDGDVSIGVQSDDSDDSGDPVVFPLALTSVNGNVPVLSLADARVGRGLKVRGVTTGTRLRIDWRTTPHRVRTFELAIYPGWSLVEALFRPETGARLAMIAFLLGPENAQARDGRRPVLVLDGESDPIHALNDLDGLPVIDDPAHAEEYLTFFCSHVWGDEGAFIIRPGSVEVSRDPSSEAWLAKAEVEYGSALFAATFKIDDSGTVSMLEDEPLRRLDVGRRPIFDRPVRWFDIELATRTSQPGWPTRPPVASSDVWTEIDTDEGRRSVWNTLAKTRLDLKPTTGSGWPNGWQRPQINLAGSRVAKLDDGDGANWFDRDWVGEDGARSASAYDEATESWRQWSPIVQLVLSGFEYDRIGDPKPAEKRETKATRLPDSAARGTPKSPPLDSRESVGSGVRRRFGQMKTWTIESLRRLGVAVRRSWVIMRDRRLLLARARRSFGSDVPSSRSNWLKAQYAQYPPTRDDYRPQPYQHLARVWRSAGDYGAADDLTFEKLSLERRVLNPHRSVRWAKKIVYETFFGYGLRPRRAALWFLFFWAAGTALVHYAAPLVVDASAVATVVSSGPGDLLVPVVPVQGGGGVPEVPCDQRNSPLYALDVLVPALDLREEARCKMSAADDPSAMIWRAGKASYAVIGWIVTSGLLLTLSGIVRRQAEK